MYEKRDKGNNQLNQYQDYTAGIDEQRKEAIESLSEPVVPVDGRSPLRTGLEQTIKDWLDENGVESSDVSLSTVTSVPSSSKLSRIDYACPMFSYAKELHKSPAIIAQECIAGIGPELAKKGTGFETVGPYLNMCFSDESLQTELEHILDPSTECGKNIGTDRKVAVVDFSAPNIAKPLGVAHLRSTVIGAAVCNLFEATGYKVIRDNHLGDWGTQFGNLIAATQEYSPEIPFEELTLTDLTKLYVKFNAAKKEDEDLKRKGQETFAKLNNGDPELVKKWNHIYNVSLNDFEAIYKRLHITFDTQIGEGYFKDRAKTIIEELAEIVPDLVVRDEGENTMYINGPHPVPLRTGKDYELYAARDLATIEQRRDDFNPDVIAYVVGEEQMSSFEGLFQVAENTPLGEKKDGGKIKFEHLKFGLLLGPDGKKMSTRKGTSGSLVEVIDEVYEGAYAAIKDHNPGVDEKVAKDTAEQLAVAAIVWNDLRTDRRSSVKFDIQGMLNMESGTVRDVAYSCSRSRSILSKSTELADLSGSVEPEFTKDVERQMVASFTEFDDVVQRAADERAPHLLVTYLQNLSQLHGNFYESCRVIGEESATARLLRLEVHAAYLKIVQSGLALLNIVIPEKV